MKKLVFDLGGSSLKIGLFQGNELVHSESVELSHTTPNFVKSEIVNQIKKHKTIQESYQISVPGQVVENRIVDFPNLEGNWSGENFEDIGNFCLRNDADCATEYLIKENKITKGRWLSLVFGTGLGTTLVENGIIIENLDLGLIEERGEKIESRISSKKHIGKEEMKSNILDILQFFTRLIAPTGFVFSGGSVKKYNLESGDFKEFNVIVSKNPELAPLLGARLIKCKK